MHICIAFDRWNIFPRSLCVTLFICRISFHSFICMQGEEDDQNLSLKDEGDENKNQTIYEHSECEERHCRKSSQITKCTGRCHSRPSLVRSVSDVGRGVCQQMTPYNSKCKVKSLPDLASKCSEGLCEFREEKVVRYKIQHSTKDLEVEEPT